ncbi:hypothetical protein B0H13DRAFT_1880183 [Mycena leptocephala]|nr:hypothetical protein B0H13DRAFT_1880183 [Mycena leptocephala]
MSTFKFLFRPPYIRPDVIQLGNNGDLLACGGSDGRLNVFSLGRGVHMTSMRFLAGISTLSWEPTTLVEKWTLWIGMRDGCLDSIPVAIEGDAQMPTPKRVLTVPGGDAVVQITSKETAVMVTTTSQRKILMDYTS